MINKKYVYYGGGGLILLIILMIFMRPKNNTVLQQDLGGEVAPAYTPFSASYNAPNLAPISAGSLGLPTIGDYTGKSGSSAGCNACDAISRIVASPKLTPAKTTWADTVNSWYSSIGRKTPDAEGVGYWTNKLALGQATYTDFTGAATGYTSSSDADTRNAAFNAVAIRAQ